jgi:hypothetical protein
MAKSVTEMPQALTPHGAWTVLLQPRRIFVFVFSIGLFVMAARNATDPDLWWHLRTGQLTLQQQHVFHHDPYSFTAAGKPWVNHEWLSDVLIFELYHSIGFTGLILTFAAIVAIAFLLVFSRCAGGVYVAGIMTIWGAIASAPSWGVRPQIFSLLLASIFLWILERSGQKLWLLWWMVPLTFLWVNLHAGYLLGIVLIALFLLGGLLDVALGRKTWAGSASYFQRLALALMACIAVVPLNPYGAKMYTYPWHTLSSPAMAAYIQEWFSPDFHKTMYLPFLLMILALLALLTISPKRPHAKDLVLLAAALIAGLHSVRNIPIFALIAAPVMSQLAASFFEQRGWKLHANHNGINIGKALLNASLVLVWIAFAGLRVHWVLGRQKQAVLQNFPVAAVAFLQSHAMPRPIFNDYNWGGYIIWKLYPEYRVFVDGRADVYGDAFLDNLASIYFVRDNWQEKFQQWPIRTVLLPPDAPLTSALRLVGGWQTVYTDSQAVILTKGK